MTRQLPRPPTAQSGRTAGHGGDAVLSLTPTEAAADRCPSGLIYRKYYGTKMMLTLLAIFYATMVAAGYIIEFTFGALGLIPTQRNAQVTQTAITWNYTTILNIIFLLLAAALLIRFFRTGAGPCSRWWAVTPPTPNPKPSAARLAMPSPRRPRRVGSKSELYFDV